MAKQIQTFKFKVITEKITLTIRLGSGDNTIELTTSFIKDETVEGRYWKPLFGNKYTHVIVYENVPNNNQIYNNVEFKIPMQYLKQI
jgi:hypothetical protein